MKHFAVFIFLVLLLASGPVFADDATDADTSVATSPIDTNTTSDEGILKNGVVYNIAKNRKMVKAGGLYVPEGLDSYMDRQMAALNDRIQKLEDHLNRIEQKIDQISSKVDKQAGNTSKATVIS